jgi:D-tyrosyl-tRNA(Tyr) deacylase
MRIVIQCVKSAKVEIEGKLISSIGRGDLLLVGFTQGDNEQIIDKMIAKVIKARIFPDDQGMTNWSLDKIGGEILAVSQFTLYGSLKDGNRPSFVEAMRPDEARKLFEYFSKKLTEAFPTAKYGVFQAMMEVSLVNDGPFTLLLDSKELGYGD